MLSDTVLKRRVEAKPNTAVPLYLCAAYAYYELDDAFLTDGAWEWLAKFLLIHWGEIDHRHKHFLTLDMLHAGTFLLGDNRDYPEIVKGAVWELLGGPAQRKRTRKKQKP